MATRDLAEFVYILTSKRQLNQSDDPRVGSARDNSTSSKVFASTSGTNSNSFKSMFSTLVPVIVYAAICLLIFWVLRARCPRVYSPRTFLSSLYPHERSKPLPNGWFNWVVPWLKVPDTDVLHQSSLDGYLFLRFLRILCVICFVGCCIIWPILLPLHAKGGMGNKQMDMLNFGNVSNPKWYYAHAVLAWVFFGFVMYMVSRECVYYINLRQAYLVSPYYAKRLSSRTVLFTCVPQPLLDEAKLRKIFGDTVRNIWIPRVTEELDDLVKEREQTALRLEKAEIELIRMANLERAKAEKFGHPDIGDAEIGMKGREANGFRQSADTEKSTAEDSGYGLTAKKVDMTGLPPSIEIQDSIEAPSSDPDGDKIQSPTSELFSDQTFELKWGMNGFGQFGPPPDVNGSVAAQWIPQERRPTHRPIANYGRSVDTIKWTRNRIKELNPRISKLVKQHKAGRAKPLPAAFIEFESQVDAQGAFQSLAHHRAFHMAPHSSGIRPSEIIWPSLRIYWWERIVRKFMVSGFVAAMVVFWSIPAALIGIISNVSSLSDIFFLKWIADLPSPILGVLTGLLPAVALSLLMGLVPGIMRMCARQAGTATVSMVELYVQQTYFIFQVVQVFLITTVASAASAAILDIIDHPMLAKDLLSSNLPKASNFYVSYFILQGLAMSATRIVHLSSIFRFHVLKSSSNPRFISMKWHRMRIVRWGSVYPVFTNMAVIAMSYSCIAPLVLGFATIAFYLVYRVYHYNIVYVYGSETDTRGLLYPHALKQILTGVYLAEVCLLGLFGLQSAFGPVVMMVMLTVFTALVHISLNDALGPLLYNLPKTLAAQDLYDQIEEAHLPNSSIPDLEDPENFQPINEADLPEYLREQSGENSRAVEGADRAGKMTVEFLSQSFKQRARSTGLDVSEYVSYIDFWTPWISPDPDQKPNFLLKWLHPEIFCDFTVLKKMIPDDLPEPEYPGDTAKDAYWPPAVVKECPVLWIPRDKGGISRQEVAHTRKAGVTITDKGVSIDDNNTLVFDLGAKSPVIMERIRY